MALSTTESEYMAVVKTSKEAPWLGGLLVSMGSRICKFQCFMIVKARFILLRIRCVVRRTKHIGIRYHTIREWCNKEIDLLKLDTKVNPMNMLTKVIPGEVQVLLDFYSSTSVGGKFLAFVRGSS